MTTRSPLPSNYNILPGDETELFQTVADWSLTGTAADRAISEDTAHYKSGIKSVKLSGGNGTITATKTVSINLAWKEEMEIWFYVYDESPVTSITSLMFAMSNDAGWLGWVGYITPGEKLEHGWNVLKMGPRNASFSGFDFSNDIVRLRVTLAVPAGQTSNVSACLLKTGMKTIPSVVFTFDDGTAAQYDDAFVYMMSKGIRGTLYLIGNYLDSVGKISTAQCDTIYAAGFDISNHSTTHIYSLVGGTYAEQLKEYTDAKNLLASKGWTRGIDHVAYPGNYITSDTPAVMAAIGAKTGRRVLQYYQAPDVQDVIYMLPGHAPVSLSNIKSYVDTIISIGATLFVMVHNPADLPGGVPTFTELVDYVISKRVPILTVSEWYNGLTNPRYRSLPVARV